MLLGVSLLVKCLRVQPPDQPKIKIVAFGQNAWTPMQWYKGNALKRLIHRTPRPPHTSLGLPRVSP